MGTIRWGVVGSGFVAREFASALTGVEGARINAVWSNTREHADRFAESFDVPNVVETVDELVHRADVDAVYVASLNHLHFPHAHQAVQAGKPVLVEKPFTLNAQEAERLIDAARDQGVLCMEAMWTRFIPAVREVRKLVESGVIGEVVRVEAALGMRQRKDSGSRFFKKEFGGGALYDMGVYPLYLAMEYLGMPTEIESKATIFRETQVDESCSLSLHSADGRSAHIRCSITSAIEEDAVITGERGSIVIHPPLFRPNRLTLNALPAEKVSPSEKTGGFFTKVMSRLLGTGGSGSRTLKIPFALNGYGYQVEAFIASLEKGEIENPIMPLSDTLNAMRVMDEARAQWDSVVDRDR
jgi:predicted dehydrogenase